MLRPMMTMMLMATMSYAQAPGTWKMTLSKPKPDGQGSALKSLVIQIEPHPEGDIFTSWSESEDGTSETESYILRLDGKGYTYRGQQFDSISARRLTGESIEVVYKKEGKVVARQIRKLHDKGRQMTIEHQLLSDSGKWLSIEIVLQKQ